MALHRARKRLSKSADDIAKERVGDEYTSLLRSTELFSRLQNVPEEHPKRLRASLAFEQCGSPDLSSGGDPTSGKDTLKLQA